jgi:hypothetical protein
MVWLGRVISSLGLAYELLSAFTVSPSYFRLGCAPSPVEQYGVTVFCSLYV